MAKYANTTPPLQTPLKTTETPTSTFEGAPAFAKDAHTELFTLAVTSFTNEKTFYEDAATRDNRLHGLVAQLASQDPEFIQRLVPYLRNVANMRSVPIVIAAEYALARGPHRRKVIDSAMARADEPAEFLGYYMARTGRKTLPAGIQRGVADAVSRLYNEYSALKYDSGRHAIRMGDVIELVHPTPVAPWQGALFAYLLDRRHHSSEIRADLTVLPMVAARRSLEASVPGHRRRTLTSAVWDKRAKDAGLTWEYVSGWLPGGMDAEAWEAVIPQMGYMALLRNLRNFDEAGISKAAVTRVQDTLTNPDAVARSRQFPYRFWSAYRATQSTQWSHPLEMALDLSVQNVPEYGGTTLVLVDVSGSMTSMGYSARGTVLPSDVAALFGAAVFGKNPKSTRVAVFGQGNKDVTPGQRGSVLRNMKVFRDNHGVGHATYLKKAAQSQYRGEDRIVVFTDEQAHDGGAGGLAKYTHYFDLGGHANVPEGLNNGIFMYGGFTDNTFRMMKLNEASRSSNWADLLGSPSWWETA